MNRLLAWKRVLTELTALGLVVLLLAAVPIREVTPSQKASSLRLIGSGWHDDTALAFGWPFEFMEVRTSYMIDLAFWEDLLLYIYCVRTGEAGESAQRAVSAMTTSDRLELGKTMGMGPPEPPHLLAFKHWNSRRVRWRYLGADMLIALAILGFVAFVPARMNGCNEKWCQFAVLDILRWILMLSVLFSFPWNSPPAVAAARSVASGIVLCGMTVAGVQFGTWSCMIRLPGRFWSCRM